MKPYFRVAYKSGRASLWIPQDAGHTGASGAYRKEYEENVAKFINTTLLGD